MAYTSENDNMDVILEVLKDIDSALEFHSSLIINSDLPSTEIGFRV